MDWIQAALNLMEGDAHTWCLPALEKLYNGELPYNGDWRKFKDASTKRFIPLDLAEADLPRQLPYGQVQGQI
jgi:hypothetical protein